jgi:hypothetical protein
MSESPCITCCGCGPQVGPLPDEVAALASLSLQRFEVSSHFEEGLLPVLMK